MVSEMEKESAGLRKTIEELRPNADDPAAEIERNCSKFFALAKKFTHIELPEQKPIGKYGKMHLDYLKQHCRGRYSTLLGEGRLNTYLSEIDEQAHEMLSSLSAELAKAQGIDEHLKATDQMRWVQLMNSVRSSAEETVMRELILA